MHIRNYVPSEIQVNAIAPNKKNNTLFIIANRGGRALKTKLFK